MGFNYDKLKAKHEDGNQWAAYSDLFMVLSTIFLLLYVVASLRSGTASLQQGIEYQQLTKKSQDLEEQLRVYNALRDEQLQHSAENEQKTYSQLMDKLSLLREEANEEKNDLIRKAKENEQKEFALNQYQQLIRNIINANILAKSQIKRRDTVIRKKDETLREKTKTIAQLNEDIDQKKQIIAQNSHQISEMNSTLEHQIEKMKEEQKRHKTSKAALNKAIAKLKRKTQEEIEKLETVNQTVAQELHSVKSDLTSAKAKLTEASTTIERQEQEKSNLVAKIEKTRSQYRAQMAEIQAAHDARLAAEREAFEKNMAAQKLSAMARAKKEAEFRANAERNARALQTQLASLGSKVAQSESELANARQAEARAREGAERALASLGNAEREKQAMSEDLRKAREAANAKKMLAEQIKKNFAAAGITANVNGGTGEVTLSFPDDYFDTGAADLKPSMRGRLAQLVPAYAKSLFSDPKTAKKLANVEIIGFASSTYRGKYVNPQSLKPEDQAAINYNLRLSFSRANAIFKYIFDPTKLKYDKQKELLPLVKVVGRGFLPDGLEPKDVPEGLSEKEFCKRFSCKQAQRVIIKFSLKD